MTRAAARSDSVLEVDQGNTRTKWRLVDSSGKCIARGAPLAGEGLEVPRREASGSRLDVRAVSVAAGGAVEALRADLAAAGYGKPRFAEAAARHGRLHSGYQEPERLGADRWVALVAATTATDGPCAVLDAGSAITLDLVAADGQHEGGWIAPGLRLMREALLRDTAGIRYDARDACVDAGPGRNTADAVTAGTAHMARDFASTRWRRFVDRHPGAILFVTGGDGALLAEGLAGDVRVVPDLVLDGLRPLLG